MIYRTYDLYTRKNKIVRVRICCCGFLLPFMYKVRAAFAVQRRLRPEVVEIWFLKHFTFRNRIVYNIVK